MSMYDSSREFIAGTIGTSPHGTAVDIITLAGIAIVAVIFYQFTKAVLGIVEKIVARSSTTWDDDLLNPSFLRAVAQLTPAIIVSHLLPGFFGDSAASVYWLQTLTSFYILWAIVRICVIFVGNLYNAILQRENLRVYAVKGIFQMLKLIFISIGIIVGLSLLIGRSPLAIITALGASAAVLMLVFKDTILGLVASVQLSANNMLHRGDWIIADRQGANGEVIDVSLTTVKVRNWDNSISTIPPYTLVSESFRNYEAMRLSGGRRVERAVYIDINSVRLCSPGEVQRLADAGLAETDNADTGAVNLGLLRRYLERYLAAHPRVNTDMIIMVRQMEPTPSGLPLQLYFFSNVTEWKEFEHIQSEIFDHVYAVIGEFGLKIFQTPAGSDLSQLRN